MVDRARHMELIGAISELKRMGQFFHDNPDLREKWIEWRRWQASIEQQQEQEELRQMTDATHRLMAQTDTSWPEQRIVAGRMQNRMPTRGSLRQRRR